MPGRLDIQLFGILLLLAVASMAYWYSRGRPVSVAEIPLASQAGSPNGIRLECVSYAPFRIPGESPFNPGTRVTPARLESDLRLLSSVSECVRIYSVQQGLDAVPEIARRLGLKIYLGAWIGRNRAENEAELNIAFDLSRRFPDVVRGLIIGNEVLLRRELPVEVIAQYLERARAAVKVPVTYADVWEFWVRNPILFNKVDFAMIHILPYWEDDPVPIEQAVPHIVNIVRHVREKMPGVALVVGETGWPSQGRTRHGAVPSLVNQARFAREFAIAAPRLGVPYNFIEGFDQPWKRRLEGAMGGNWGLFDSAGEQKFAIRGPVPEDVHWLRGWAAGILGGLAAVLSVLILPGMRQPQLGSAPRKLQLAALAALGGMGAGAIAMAQWNYMLVWNRTGIEWCVTGVYALAALAIWVSAMLISINPAAILANPSAISVNPPAISAKRSTIGARIANTLIACFAGLRLMMLFGAAAMMVLLAFDARYRGFPWPLYSLPAFAFLLVLRQTTPFWRSGLEERMLSTVVVLCGLVVLYNEGASNYQAILFVVLMIAMASLAVRGDYRWLSLRTRTSAPASAPTAANS